MHHVMHYVTQYVMHYVMLYVGRPRRHRHERAARPLRLGRRRGRPARGQPAGLQPYVIQPVTVCNTTCNRMYYVIVTVTVAEPVANLQDTLQPRAALPVRALLGRQYIRLQPLLHTAAGHPQATEADLRVRTVLRRMRARHVRQRRSVWLPGLDVHGNLTYTVHNIVHYIVHCIVHYIRLQSLLHTVAASISYGCSL